MAYRRKTWQEKLADKESLPKVVTLQEKFPRYNAVHKMGAEAGDLVVLVNPSEVVELMKKVPRGRVITITEICKALATRHHVKACCSLTTGIFIMTAANATEEMAGRGKPLGIPYWRTLKADGSLNEKYPGGTQKQKALLEHEGFTVMKKGKRLVVQEYESFLVPMSDFV